MALPSKTRLIENLIFAAAVGLAALVLASLGLLSDIRRESFERDSLSSLAKRPIGMAAIRAGDRETTRVYRIGGKGEALYGAVLSVRSSKGAALVAALFSPDGELQAARSIDEDLAGQPYSRDSWFADFLGRGGASPFPAQATEARSPAAVSGATESFMATGAALERASALVRRAAGGRL
jgi:hypothetical protein